MSECVKLVSTYLSNLHPIIPIQGLCPPARRLASVSLLDLKFGFQPPPQGPAQLHFHDATTSPSPNPHDTFLGLFCGTLSFRLRYSNLSQNLTVKKCLTDGPRPRYLHLIPWDILRIMADP